MLRSSDRVQKPLECVLRERQSSKPPNGEFRVSCDTRQDQSFDSGDGSLEIFRVKDELRKVPQCRKRRQRVEARADIYRKTNAQADRASMRPLWVSSVEVVSWKTGASAGCSMRRIQGACTAMCCFDHAVAGSRSLTRGRGAVAVAMELSKSTEHNRNIWKRKRGRLIDAMLPFTPKGAGEATSVRRQARHLTALGKFHCRRDDAISWGLIACTRATARTATSFRAIRDKAYPEVIRDDSDDLTRASLLNGGVLPSQ